MAAKAKKTSVKTKKPVKVKKQPITKKPTPKQMEKLKLEDTGYVDANKDSLVFLEGRRQAIFNIARHYHLDVEELFQEGYEVLLTCLRDFTPIYEKEQGKFISVKFTTFFGNRMENRAMEMRNRDPEYQARQAFTEKMSGDEKARFKADPPLLVQHLDQETTMQETLAGEASMAKSNVSEDVALRIMRDSFFDKKLSELVAREGDEKKQAALLHVKVGGVYNFQEIAYHFGVTDSRASQVMNELMDAFYVQRMIDGNLGSVVYDFGKLKFNEKRVVRLIKEALQNSTKERAQEIIAAFKKDYPAAAKIKPVAGKQAGQLEHKEEKKEKSRAKAKPPAYEEIFTAEENEDYELVGVELRPIKNLKSTNLDFRAPEDEDEFQAFLEDFDPDSSHYPALVSEEGYIIDGERRIRAARAKGRTEYLCIVRKIPADMARKLLRVSINIRLKKPNKVELYYIVGALSDLGLSQQKIADCLGASRTNVLVYAKVRDKANPKLRALFEDGLIQITNASSCADFDDEIQSRLANFIRRQGVVWSKGSKFNELYLAASKGKLDKLEAKLTPDNVAPLPEGRELTTAASGDAARTIQALQKRIENYEQADKDAEVWSSQRESVIAAQNERISEAETEVDRLKKELEAAELMRFGSPQAVEQELKDLKSFYGLTEKLSGSAHALSQASRQIRRMELRRKQVLEVRELMDKAEGALNALRLELINLDQKEKTEKAQQDAPKQAHGS